MGCLKGVQYDDGHRALHSVPGREDSVSVSDCLCYCEIILSHTVIHTHTHTHARTHVPHGRNYLQHAGSFLFEFIIQAQPL